VARAFSPTLVSKDHLHAFNNKVVLLNTTLPKMASILAPRPRNSQTNFMSLPALTSTTHWIRNQLDPLIAQCGSSALTINDILALDAFFRALLSTPTIILTDLQHSRVHVAILNIVGLSTRWPEKLIERAEEVKELWEARFGCTLREVGTDALGEGGKLEAFRGCEGMSWEEMAGKWLKEPGTQLNPLNARRRGDLGFKPGEWVLLTAPRYCDQD
jgi:hypothetical protein